MKLKPCPFCLSDYIYFVWGGDFDHLYFFCGECGARGPKTPDILGTTFPEERARENWNQRYGRDT